jgi:hypothetical protein
VQGTLRVYLLTQPDELSADFYRFGQFAGKSPDKQDRTGTGLNAVCNGQVLRQSTRGFLTAYTTIAAYLS